MSLSLIRTLSLSLYHIHTHTDNSGTHASRYEVQLLFVCEFVTGEAHTLPVERKV